MKALGFKRIDKQGRFIIPREYLKHFEVKSGDNFEVWMEDDRSLIIQRLAVARCIFCDSTNDLLDTQIDERYICKACFELFDANQKD